MDSIFNKSFLDRINRMIRIISRFPDETVKTKSAWRRNDSILNPTLKYRAVLMKDKLQKIWLKRDTLIAKRLRYFRFLPETGNKIFLKFL